MADKNFTNLDFGSIREKLKSHISENERFQDFDFLGSNMAVLLDVLAYNTYMQSHYLNMAISESFLDSAQLRNSIISHAKELNYLPRGYRSAYVDVDITITAPSRTENRITIPPKTKFVATVDGVGYTFSTSESHIATRVSSGSSQFVARTVRLYEGRWVKEVLSVDNTTISNERVDTDSVRVSVNDEYFVYSSDIYGNFGESKVFYIGPEFDDKYAIVFGKDTFGYQPKQNDTIVVEYRVCDGENANGIKRFSPKDDIGEINKNNISLSLVEGFDCSLNGANPESNESIKYFAPLSIQTQERAVTKSDYETLLKKRFPAIQAISVFGGDEVDPPRYGSVVIAIDTVDKQGSASAETDIYAEYLRDKTPLTIEPIFINADFMFVALDINVQFASAQSPRSISDISTLIENGAIEYSDLYLNRFGARLSESSLASYLANLDENIVSVTLDPKVLIEYTPDLNASESPTFDFQNELVKPYRYNTSAGFEDFSPSIYSTVFTRNGSSGMFYDNGGGGIIMVSTNTPKSVVANFLGIVDYESGTANLNNVVFSGYEGSTIALTARPKSPNIKSEKNKILAIDKKYININVEKV